VDSPRGKASCASNLEGANIWHQSGGESRVKLCWGKSSLTQGYPGPKVEILRTGRWFDLRAVQLKVLRLFENSTLFEGGSHMAQSFLRCCFYLGSALGSADEPFGQGAHKPY
jgi:hypothetical protein